MHCFADRNSKAARHRFKALACRHPHQTRQWLADGEDRRIIALGMGPTKESQPCSLTAFSISSAAAPRKPPAPRSRRHRPPRGLRAASLDEDRLAGPGPARRTPATELDRGTVWVREP